MPDPEDFGTWPDILLRCINKTRYTRGEVRRVIRALREDHGRVHLEYFCNWCGGWHFTRKQTQKDKKINRWRAERFREREHRRWLRKQETNTWKTNAKS